MTFIDFEFNLLEVYEQGNTGQFAVNVVKPISIHSRPMQVSVMSVTRKKIKNSYYKFSVEVLIR